MRKAKPPPIPATYKIAILAPEESAVTRQILGGIIDYRGRRTDWELCHVHTDKRFLELQRFHEVFDAVIAQVFHPGQIPVLQRLKCPVVVLCHESPDFPCVIFDEAAIGRMGFNALRAIGLKSFAFAGFRNAVISEQRGDAFEAAAKEAGLPCQRYRGLLYPHMDRDAHEARPAREWLGQLPVPTGLLISVSELALEVLHQCRQIGRRVPEELSILAVDDDELICEFGHPTISAIDQNAYGIGHTAAALLDRMLRGEKVLPQIIRITPRAVVHRGSTQAVHAAQPWLRKAIELIHTSLDESLRVSDIVKKISVSRRTLENAFTRELGQSVHDVILGARVEQAKRLLEETDLKPFQIALRCGFPYASSLSRSFKKVVGMTPIGYRERFGRRRLG